MTTYLKKSCLFSLLCVSFVNVYEFVYASLPFRFDDGLLGLIVLVLDHCPAFYSE